MARFVGVCRDDASELSRLGPRQLPVYIDDMQTMIAEFEDPCAGVDNCGASSGPGTMSLQSFTAKCESLEPGELEEALSVDFDTFCSYSNNLIPCVGCRRCVEKLFLDLGALGNESLDPFMVMDGDILTVSTFPLIDPKQLHRELVRNYGRMRNTIENLTKCRKNKRCGLHSMEQYDSCKAQSCGWTWDEMWDSMASDCHKECCIVEGASLSHMLQTYLHKHKFCPECKTKLLKAYDILTGEVEGSTEPDYNDRLYSGLRYCQGEQHLHLKSCVNYLNSLVDRAETEMKGNSRERHAKTVEVGQTEVLTCLGLYMHGRLHRITSALRTLQTSFQLLYCTAAIAIYSNFKAYMLEKDGNDAKRMAQLCSELQKSTVKPQTKQINKRKKKANKHIATVVPRTDGSNCVESSGTPNSCEHKCSGPCNEKSWPIKLDNETDKKENCVTPKRPDSGCGSSREGSPGGVQSRGPSSQCHSCINHIFALDPLYQKSPPSLLTMISEDCKMLEDGSDTIPPEYIKWFVDHRSTVAAERIALREKMRHKFDEYRQRSSLQTQ